jgi:hypothetical protein
VSCSFCGGPWHAATGCYYGPRTRACLRCVADAWRWIRQHTAARKGRPDFYAAAAKWQQHEPAELGCRNIPGIFCTRFRGASGDAPVFAEDSRA